MPRGERAGNEQKRRLGFLMKIAPGHRAAAVTGEGARR